jgi:polar amino acid transport system ATP-binding protein
MAQTPESMTYSQPVPPSSGVLPMVDARDVHKYFHRNEVLKGISLQVQRREVVVLLGPSGSGKTTFLRCINHLEKVNYGRIYVDGELVGYREEPDGQLK